MHKNNFVRGALTKEIQKEAREFLGEELMNTELRLLPYLDYCIKNSGEFSWSKVDAEERVILESWAEREFLEVENHNVACTREFYDFIQRVLWLGYVEHKLDEKGAQNG